MAKLQVKKVHFESPYNTPNGKTEYFYGVEFTPNVFLLEDGSVKATKAFSEGLPYYCPEHSALGSLRSSRHDGVLVAENTRCVPEAIRTLLSEEGNRLKVAYEKFLAAYRAIDEAQKLTKEATGKVASEILTLKGELSNDAFTKELYEVLPVNDDWRISVYNTRLYITTDKEIEKWFREGSFVYEEYDGTIHMESDAKKDPSYQAYIRKYHKELPLKHCEYEEYLSLGDKDWLIYNASYKYELGTNHYSQALVDKVAKAIYH